MNAHFANSDGQGEAFLRSASCCGSGRSRTIISFGGGYPDPALFPLEKLAVVFQEGDRRAGAQRPCSTPVSTGMPRLREQLAVRMGRERIRCSADKRPHPSGRTARDWISSRRCSSTRTTRSSTENPTFLGALIAFNPYEPRYLAVRTDEEGMDVDQLEHLLKRHSRPKLLYTMPDFQNPTGVHAESGRAAAG